MKLFNNLKYLLVFIGFVLWLFSCKSAILEEIYKAKNKIEESPGLALTALNSLEGSYNEMTDKEKAYFGLFYFMALDKNEHDMKPADFIDHAAGYFTRHGKAEELAHCYLYKARMLWYNNNHFGEAVKLLLTAAGLVENGQNYGLWGKIHFDLGVLYANQNLTEKALLFYNKALSGFEKVDDHDNIAKTYTVIGRLYRENEEFRLAFENFEKALPLAKDSVAMGHIFSQLANYYYELSDLDSAYYYVNKSLLFPTYPQNLSNLNSLLADIYFDKKMYDSAVYYTNIALDYKKSLYTERECYRLLANVASIKNDEKTFSFYLNKYHDCQDSILIYENKIAYDIPATEKLFHSEEEVLRTKKNLQRALLLLFAAISGIFLLYRYYGRLARFWNKKITEENKKNKKMILRQQLLWDLNEAKIKLSAKKKALNTVVSTNQLKNIYNNLLHFDDREIMAEKMDVLFNGAGTAITHTYPAVNEKELKYIFMFLLNTPVNDICFVLNYKPDSLRKMRYRLAPKLNLQGAGELNRFLETFL